jgi:hypothetical protein
MNRDLRRNLIVKEILQKIGDMRNLSIDCIKIILENDVLF